MKKLFIILGLLLLLIGRLWAQEISLEKGWKFSTGDSAIWASPTYNDQHWKSISLDQSWEEQGYPKYDGFGWYRLHVLISSTIKEKAFLKDSIRINLGMVDDNDEVYLNGTLIGKYGGKDGPITTSKYGARLYVIAANNSAILWDKENVLSIRIFDTGGPGGIYGSPHKITMADLMDNVSVNTEADFIFGNKNTISKQIKFIATTKYKFNGTIVFSVIDPERNKVMYEKTSNAEFTSGKPFAYNFTIALPGKKSYRLKYAFKDEKSGKIIEKEDATPYILTPELTDKPRINGPSIFGARPDNPFLYLIPATGKAPLEYEAIGLPAGLKLNRRNGIIKGVVNKEGTYAVILKVRNSKGVKIKNFNIVIGNLIGLTPALGWNSWNAFGLTVNDQKVRVAAKTMTDKLSAHGWTYVNMDDGWEAEFRTTTGEIMPNKKFPDMKGLTDYVHSLGLKVGIYSSPGSQTCGGYLGSWQHEEQDAKTYGAWGIDYLKYDWCSYSQVTASNPNLDDLKRPYQVMRAALDKIPRDIMFSFCQYGMGDVWKWGAEIGGNSWRSTGDIEDTWSSMAGIGFKQTEDAPYAQPGHFNDPDMLVVGKVGWGDNQHNTRLNPDEQYTHISLWSLLSAPLLIGCDMGKLDKFTLNLLTNDEVLAIDQDALGKSAQQLVKMDDYQLWFKDLEDGSKAVGIFNTSNQYHTITINRNENGLAGYTKIRDVWQQKYVIADKNNYTAKVAPHGVVLVKFSK